MWREKNEGYKLIKNQGKKQNFDFEKGKYPTEEDDAVFFFREGDFSVDKKWDQFCSKFRMRYVSW